MEIAFKSFGSYAKIFESAGRGDAWLASAGVKKCGGMEYGAVRHQRFYMGRKGITMEAKNKNGMVTVVVALIVSLAAIACVTIFTTGFVGYKKSANGSGLTATGSASCDFESDLIVWRGSFSAYGVTTGDAYAVIKNDTEVVKNYLLQNGVSEEELVFSSVDISQRYYTEYDEYGNYVRNYPDGYDLYQSVTVTSNDVDKVEKISRDITNLIESGVQFSSYSPEYYCTKLDEVKLDLIEKATDNAKQRIDIMAEGSGSKAGKLLSANLGVFQITAQNSGSGEYSYDGAFDTTSRYKTAMITVRLNYEAE